MLLFMTLPIMGSKPRVTWVTEAISICSLPGELCQPEKESSLFHKLIKNATFSRCTVTMFASCVCHWVSAWSRTWNRFRSFMANRETLCVKYMTVLQTWALPRPPPPLPQKKSHTYLCIWKAIKRNRNSRTKTIGCSPELTGIFALLDSFPQPSLSFS